MDLILNEKVVVITAGAWIGISYGRGLIGFCHGFGHRRYPAEKDEIKTILHCITGQVLAVGWLEALLGSYHEKI